MLTKKELLELVDKVKACPNTGPYHFFTRGSGFSCKEVIDYFKECSDVIVVDRKGQKWRKGERYESES